MVEPSSRQQVLATFNRGTVIYTPPARVPLSRRLIAVVARSVYIPGFPSTENPPIMSLTTLTQYWPVGHTLKSTSKLDAGVLVLATSLVSFHAHVYFRLTTVGSCNRRLTCFFVTLSPALSCHM